MIGWLTQWRAHRQSYREIGTLGGYMIHTSWLASFVKDLDRFMDDGTKEAFLESYDHVVQYWAERDPSEWRLAKDAYEHFMKIAGSRNEERKG